MLEQLLNKLREFFCHEYKDFKIYINEEAPEIAEKAIKFVIEQYNDLNGDQKMELAIQFVLQNLHVPAIYTVIASKTILKAIKSIIQDKYDEMK